jgi:hypothetical protein
MINKVRVLIGASLICFSLGNVQATTLGYADVVLDFFDSGAGPIAGPYGGTSPGGPGFPIPVSTDVVSISVENLPPVSVQKFPHGLVG